MNLDHIRDQVYVYVESLVDSIKWIEEYIFNLIKLASDKDSRRLSTLSGSAIEIEPEAITGDSKLTS